MHAFTITYLYVGLALPKHTSIFHQDFLRLLSTGGLLPPQAPLKTAYYIDITFNNSTHALYSM